MEAYTYKGISDGKYVEGDIEAINLDEASHLLKEKKIIITNIIKSKKKAGEKKKKGGSSLFGKSKKVKVEDILIFSKQFATMVKAGLPILQVLAMLRDQMESQGIKDIIEDILKVASRAPSGTNIQPWNVHVLMGEPLKQFTDKAVEIFFDDNLVKKNERVHYMEKFREPYLARRRKVGWDLYNLLGIKKGDYEKTKNFHSQNFKFFSAPVGMILKKT